VRAEESSWIDTFLIDVVLAALTQSK